MTSVVAQPEKALGQGQRQNPGESLLRNLRRVEHCPNCGQVLIGVPVLECTHCGDSYPLRAYFYSPRSGQYIAECVDLDLLSQGTSPEQAVARLQEAMASYLAAAFDGGPTKGLVLRPSPLSHRLHYRWRCFTSRLSAIFRGRHRKHLMLHKPESENMRFSHC